MTLSFSRATVVQAVRQTCGAPDRPGEVSVVDPILAYNTIPPTVAGGCRIVETLIEGAANCSRDSEASPPQAKPCASIMLLPYLHTYLPVHVPVFTIYHFSLLKLLTSQHAIPRTIRHIL